MLCYYPFTEHDTQTQMHEQQMNRLQMSASVTGSEHMRLSVHSNQILTFALFIYLKFTAAHLVRTQHHRHRTERLIAFALHFG